LSAAAAGSLRDRVTILFDLDGTLIDSTEAILESFDYAFARFGESTPSKESIKGLIGYPLDHMFESLGAKARPVADYVEAYKEHYREISCTGRQRGCGESEAASGTSFEGSGSS